MFEKGNYVINTNNGICEIQDLVTMNMSGTAKEYFLLVPISEPTAKVYIPVDVAENRIRLVITKEEAWDIIKGIPSIESVWIENEKERSDAGKKNTAVDERYFKLAENQLHAELAFALGEPKQNIAHI